MANYVAQGFEVGLHPTTGCQNYTPTSLDQIFSSQLETLALQYPSMPPPRTNRTHCVVWSDYTSQADIEASPSEPGSRFDIESSQPGEPISQWAGAALWP